MPHVCISVTLVPSLGREIALSAICSQREQLAHWTSGARGCRTADDGGSAVLPCCVMTDPARPAPAFRNLVTSSDGGEVEIYSESAGMSMEFTLATPRAVQAFCEIFIAGMLREVDHLNQDPADVTAQFSDLLRLLTPGSPARTRQAIEEIRAADVSQQKLVLVAVIWLAAVWLPAIAIGLPEQDHQLFSDWLGTISLAITLAAIVLKKKDRVPVHIWREKLIRPVLA
jgi:hypothetical protein